MDSRVAFSHGVVGGVVFARFAVPCSAPPTVVDAASSITSPLMNLMNLTISKSSHLKLKQSESMSFPSPLRLAGLASRVRLAVGSAVSAFKDPERGDMVATLGEITGQSSAPPRTAHSIPVTVRRFPRHVPSLLLYTAVVRTQRPLLMAMNSSSNSCGNINS